MPNIHRQSSDPRISPDSVGPMAGATAMTIVMVPIAPRRSGGINDITVVINNGIMMAVPPARMIRPTNSTGNPGERRHQRAGAEQRHRRQVATANREPLQQ